MTFLFKQNLENINWQEEKGRRYRKFIQLCEKVANDKCSITESFIFYDLLEQFGSAETEHLVNSEKPEHNAVKKAIYGNWFITFNHSKSKSNKYKSTAERFDVLKKHILNEKNEDVIKIFLDFHDCSGTALDNMKHCLENGNPILRCLCLKDIATKNSFYTADDLYDIIKKQCEIETDEECLKFLNEVIENIFVKKGFKVYIDEKDYSYCGNIKIVQNGITLFEVDSDIRREQVYEDFNFPLLENNKNNKVRTNISPISREEVFQSIENAKNALVELIIKS